MQLKFVCDLAEPSSTLHHFWEHSIGSGHATLALRADWQQQLIRCHKELGFQHVRFHGILSDDMGTLVAEQDKLLYSFYNADTVIDFLCRAGIKPFLELSFMPTALASGSDTVFHYKANITAPKDYAAWKKFIHTLIQHWVDRYGIDEVRKWYFEVWNEPNLEAFWKARQEGYFELYKHTAKAIKKIDPSLRVGGPATAHNDWIQAFYDFCSRNKIDFDFISTHHYPTDAMGKPGDDTIAQLAKSKRSVLQDQVMTTKQEAADKPVYYTEWSSSSNPFDALHDQSYAATFIVKTIMEANGYVDGYSYWTFSDIFEENYFASLPFHGGFGLLNVNGIPKPAYRVYELLHKIGREVFSVKGMHGTVDVWVARSKHLIHIILTNFALPHHDIDTESVRVSIANIPEIKKVFSERVDEEHANARAYWEQMGKPSTLLPAQVEELEDYSKLVREPVTFSFKDGTAAIDITIPPQGTAFITIETNG